MRTTVVAGADPSHSGKGGLAAVGVLDGRFAEEEIYVATVGKGTDEAGCCVVVFVMVVIEMQFKREID